MDAPVLASFSLTHVHYDPTDPLSYLCAWLALVPQALIIVYTTLVFASREAEITLTLAGQLACEAINFMLKRIIKEERPKQMHGKGYGMPSSHAQFVAFFSVHLTLFLLLRHRPRTFSKVKAAHTPLTLGKRAGLSAFALAGAGAVAASRIYLSYHTPKQVAVGWIAGTICAVGWFVINTCLRRTGVLDWALEQPLVRYFRVRDLCIEEDVPQAGWERWEERGVERLKRQGVPTHVHQE